MPQVIIVVAVIVVVGFFLVRLRSRPKADPDIQVLAQLRKHGSDLDKPHNIDFFLYLPTEAAATTAANQIQLLGYNTEVAPPPPGYTSWGCKATKSMVPTLISVKQVGAELTRIATSLSGNYDGWGTPVVK